MVSLVLHGTVGVLVSGLELLTIMGPGVISVVGMIHTSGAKKVREHKQFHTKECLEKMETIWLLL